MRHTLDSLAYRALATALDARALAVVATVVIHDYDTPAVDYDTDTPRSLSVACVCANTNPNAANDDTRVVLACIERDPLTRVYHSDHDALDAFNVTLVDHSDYDADNDLDYRDRLDADAHAALTTLARFV